MRAKSDDKKISKKQDCDKTDIVIEQLKKAVQENNDKYLRALADYQNLEKRVAREKDELVKTANKNLVLKLLPFLDHLDKAQIFIKDKDLKLIKDYFLKLLVETGVKEVDVSGKIFDPYTAEAIEVVAGDQDNIIVEVVRKAYSYNGQIIRVAQVKVAKKIKN